MSNPTCPVCCDTLGQRGGPTTLPCGHNGCVECMKAVQDSQAACPLCRSSFDKDLRLSLNTQLRDLVDVATRHQVDESDLAEGWVAFPTSQMTSEHYSAELLNGNERTPRPSAPPCITEDVYSLEPPVWMPDSSSDSCLGCARPFLPLFRMRHHCRLCGKLFCDECTSRRRHLPPRFPERDPQRVCDMCAAVLDPLQYELAEQKKRYNKIAVNDLFDWSSARSWLNSPFSGNMEHDIYRATNVLKTFHKMIQQFPQAVPYGILNSATGVVILSEVKVAFGVWSCRLGTGLAVSKVGGHWGRPCSIGSVSVGAGLQIGGQLMDAVIVLPDRDSVEAFSGDKQICLSGGASAALGVGPGFSKVLSLRVNNSGGKHVAEGYCFCLCRGAFLGASLEGTVISFRSHINHAFYGTPVSSKQLLLEESAPSPLAATHLYDQLAQTFTSDRSPFEKQDSL